MVLCLQETLKARLDAELDSKAQAIASAQVEEEVSRVWRVYKPLLVPLYRYLSRESEPSP